MVTTSYRLRKDFTPRDLILWYRNAHPGEMISVTLLGRTCVVRLIRGTKDYVRWWPEAGRGVTVSVNDAVQRLDMF